LAPVSRMEFYLKLIGEDTSKVPDAAADFGELPNQIEQPIDDSSLKLIAYEKEELDKADSAAEFNVIAAIPKILEGVLHAFPNLELSVEPIGIGIAATFGGANLSGIARVASDVLQLASAQMQHESARASRKAGYLRQLQDRVQQANNAGYEIKSIDKQILTQQIRISIANQEIINQQQQIDNSLEVEDFLRNKYSNQELYAWMTDQVRGLYYQAYTLAYDLAKRAEKLFRFERGLTTSSFIQFGYWDPAYDGLLSGERLFNGLKQLEAAYQEKRGHDFEISKSISLRQLDPLALLQLRETGSCEFAVPEVLFDMDYPGHYMRRIKSVGLRIPCVLGTYTSLNCTLRLLEHRFRTSSIATGKSDYPERTDGSEDRFATTNVPITAIAVSSLDDESGVFDLNFHDERYLPFEGAGVISKWRIELPDTFRQFDYDTMTDVVMRLRITSMDAGDKLKQAASGTVLDFVKSVEDLSRDQGLFVAFDLKSDFSDAWYTANHPLATATERVITIDKLSDKLPIFTRGRSPAKIRATDIYLFVSGSLPASAFTVTQDGNDFPFTDGPSLGSGSTVKSFVATDIDAAMGGLQIKIADTKNVIEKMWLVERYTLQ
jgi:Tc toxin complex TcA C-terminal TcB-binding domain